MISIDLIGVHAQRAGSRIEWAIGLVGGSKTIERALYNTTGKALILLGIGRQEFQLSRKQRQFRSTCKMLILRV